MRKKKILLAFAAVVSIVLVLGQIFPFPNAVQDLVTGKFPSNCTLTYPLLYKVFAPFFLFADTLTILSVKQHIAFILFINLLWFGFRGVLLWGKTFSLKLIFKEIGKYLLLNLTLALVYVLVVLVPHPMAKLEAKDTNTLIIDFHSHTQNSWDARKSFSLDKNILWHKNAGFHAAFVTDHNVYQEPKTSVKGVQALRGEEVSLYQSHWLLLGIEKEISKSVYETEFKGIKKFIKDVKELKKPVLFASLPEYWFYHWGTSLENFADWGLDGFEIVNSAPLALDFPSEFRKGIVELCRKRNLAVIGVTDNHGWGSTCYVWNLMNISDWRVQSKNDLENATLRRLKTERYNAVQVVTRVKNESYPFGIRRWCDTPCQIWKVSRTIPFYLAFVCLVWIWIPLVFYFKCCIKNCES